jgi:phospholipid/cholesterol/gamma-HCH transport system substrate-binding protein
MSIAINELIQDKEFISSVKNSVTNLDSLVVSAREIIDRNKGKINSTMDDIAELADNTNDLIGNNKEKINKLINDLDAISTDLNQLLKNADITVKDFTNILKDVQKITDDINSKESTIGKLIRDEDFANRLDSAFSNLKNLLNQFEKHGVNVNVRLGTRP